MIFLSSSIAVKRPEEEMALRLRDKKSNIKKVDLIEYYAIERLGLNNKTVDKIMADIYKCSQEWKRLIEISFLSDVMKEKYLNLLKERIERFT